MAEGLDIDAMISRFKERATSVKKRNLPPVGGDERQQFLDQAKNDFMDFGLLGDATGKLEGGILTLTVDLRPSEEEA